MLSLYKKKAEPPILVTLSGIVTEVIFVLLENALLPITATSFGMLISPVHVLYQKLLQYQIKNAIL